ALNRGYLITTVLAAGLFGFAAWAMLQPAGADVDLGTPGTQLASPETWAFYWICGIVGMVIAFVYVWITQYYTEARYRPVKEIARAAETGPATNILSGFSRGVEATALAPIGVRAHLSAQTTTNGAGIMEMWGKARGARPRLDKLDAAGNTTKALTKGYAVGSAALAAFLLFTAYLHEGRILRAGAGITTNCTPIINLAIPEVFVGALIGVMIVFLFSSLAIRAVGPTAWEIINDVRAQFRA